MNNWNLAEAFKNRTELLKEISDLKVELDKVTEFKTKLNTMSEINDYLIYEENVSKRISKLYSYLSMSFDTFPEVKENYEDLSNMESLYLEFEGKKSFVNIYLLAHSIDEYKEASKNYNKIKENLYNLDKLISSKAHIKGEAEEKILSSYLPVTNMGHTLHQALYNSDFSPITVTLKDKTKVKVTPGNYTSYLVTLKNQEDRKTVFEAYFSYFEKHKNTFASIYKLIVESDIALKESRGYKSVLSAYLEDSHIPDSVYLSLINTTRKNSDSLKKYIKLRQKALKLDEYHTYDRFQSIAKNTKKYTYEDSKKLVLEALKPMGEDFLNHAKEALKEGHVDVYPKDGKRSGAYSTQIEGLGSYILLNHTDSIDSAFTVAHECGHSIHTLYAEEAQPYATKNYEIFVAEVASTFNEQLFLDYLLKNTKDKDSKIEALQQACDSLVLTYYRQVVFAAFEYEARNLRLKGEAITADSLNKIMHDLYLDFYGIDLDKEPLKKLVWAYIPHIYNSPFYVFKYATSYSASSLLYKNVKEGKKDAKELYINMLKDGGSDYPIEIIKKAGCDLTTEAPFKAVCDKLSQLVDELEKLLNE